ncbi:hypothetical protein HHK36_029799 [Tetracentron sinense]|uniref:Ribosomal protein L34e superfamily protein n=1 Tax=Tetracentron sinense TaxID=13715 RepID=A0A834YFF6_TETSI|nr:hypothetical protein HHK36_029799 [Tetracentron sinense]
MVYFDNSISLCKPLDQPTNMANPLKLTDPSSNSRKNHQAQRNRKQPNSVTPIKITPCHRSRTVAVDVVILIAVIGACGFLFFPYIKLFCDGIVEIGGATVSMVREELCQAPMIYAFLGLGVLFAILAVWGISKFFSRKCWRPNCLGLHKAAEFDIQLETEECVKNSTSSLVKDGGGKGVFELGLDHHKELEAELRKMAPQNGRAVLVFRARCGCSVGRMEVPAPKKFRKIAK